MKNIFLRTAFVVVLMSGAVLAAAQDNVQMINIPLSNPCEPLTLEISIMSARIEVIGENREDVEFAVSAEEGSRKIITPSGTQNIKGAAYTLEVEENDNHISVDTDWGRNKITVIVRVPRNENLDLSTTNDGEIIVSNIQGALELENTNGPITATNIAGSVIAETVNATIDVGFSSIDGSSAMSFSSINGDLIIGLPADAGVQLHLDSARGEIFSDFEVDVQPSKPIVERVDGRGRGRVQVRVENAIVANVNGGGSVIKLKTLNGDIQIRKSGN